MNYQIDFEKNPKADDLHILTNGIFENHFQKKGMKPLDSFAFFIRDESGEIIGGCSGEIMYGSLFVSQLWLREEMRHKGYGTLLMQRAEQLAQKSGCHFIALNTFNWEAPDFYIKLGFYNEFERKGFDKNSIFYFLRKDLN
jgi:GNAT superfamily N-acetyltransferase